MGKNIKKIGFNGRPFCQEGMRGLSRHTLELIKNLKVDHPELDIYIYCYDQVSPFYKKELSFAHFRDKKRRPKILWDLLYLSLDIKRDGLDLFHSTNNLGVPFFLFTRIPFFVTIHDTFTHTARMKKGRGLKSFWGRLNYLLELFLLKRSTSFFTVSEHAREEIHATMKIPLDKIVVAYNGANFPQAPEKSRNEDYYLYVGGFEERKNIKTMLLAFLAYRESGSLKLSLKMAGSTELASEEVREILKSHPEIFIPTGPVSDRELQELYLNARALIFPSREEGFGLPLVEAMTAGCPVIASDIQVFKEIAEGVACFFSVNNAQDLKEKILILEGNETLRREMRQKGQNRSVVFTWKIMAQKIYSTYIKFNY